MMRSLLRAKLHRLVVTDADLNYEGSITLPPALMAAGNFLAHEHVHVWNVTNGARFETYSIYGLPDSNSVCVNGAAARLVSPGDILIVAAFCYVEEEEARMWQPLVVFVDSNNTVREMRSEVPFFKE